MIDAIKNSGILAPIAARFADFAVETQPDSPNPEHLWLLTAALAQTTTSGDSALSADSLNGKTIGEVLAPELTSAPNTESPAVAADPFPKLDSQSLRENDRVIGEPGERKPIIFENGMFYLHRFHEYETAIEDFIQERWGKVESAPLPPASILDLLGENSINGEPNWQKVAAILSRRSKFLVVSGGPGTGKTTSAATIIALALEHNPEAVVKLVTPTGKAADRLAESIRSFKEKRGAALPEHIRDAIPDHAETIHRFLGINAFKPYYDKFDKAPVDFLLVDEASMVSLHLFAKLFEALPPSCQVVLLGDKDQLMAVENGDVLRAITEFGGVNQFSKGFAAEVAKTTNGEAKIPVSPDGASPDIAVQLTQNRRFSKDSGIAALAAAVNNSTKETPPETIFDIFDSHSDIEFRKIREEKDLDDVVAAVAGGWLDKYRAVLKTGAPRDILETISEFRVLCAVNEGPFGVEGMNQRLAKALAGGGAEPAKWFHGTPIIITRNDYKLHLMNGDVGVVIAPPGQTAKAHFYAENGETRDFNLSALDEYKPAFALSIHKSQGSEFDEILVILPPRACPVVTKELIYTAITRAKTRCAVAASKEILTNGAATRLERVSGLRERMRNAWSDR